MPQERQTESATKLLTLDPEHFAREADHFLDELSDGERGLLASALVGASAAESGGGEQLIAQLRLDSADPSLMSRSDVATLLAHLQAHDSTALRRALQTLRDAPTMLTTLGGGYAPSRGSSDTSNLGTDPTIETAAHDQSSPR
ncbi:MAG TPA: hypothetical protein VIL85_07590 [Thermomicrobiales bacterium]|jgi:hypothetical protein